MVGVASRRDCQNGRAANRGGARPLPRGAAGRGEIPIEVRFEFLLHMSADKRPEHYHAADGTIVEGPPPVPDGSHDPVGGQLEAADREIFHQVIESVNGKLAAVQERGRQIANAVRITGTMPTREQIKRAGRRPHGRAPNWPCRTAIQALSGRLANGGAVSQAHGSRRSRRRQQRHHHVAARDFAA